jgi:PelA/Pel-15E family pectate lyase
MTFRILLIGAFLALVSHAPAKVIGTNPPAASLTSERIATLAADQQPAWRDYLARSMLLRAADQAFLADEIKTHNVKAAAVPPEGRDARSVPLDRSAAWYGTDEAVLMAANIISYQTPAGGWSKNIDPTKHPRQPGESFSHDNLSRFLGAGDFDQPLDAHWNYVGTFDNDATVTELHFLAKVATAAGATGGAASRAAFQRGLDYIFNSQYPNGGWPQVYPLEGGYHDAITINDGAMIQVLELVQAIASGDAEFGFLSSDTHARAVICAQRGLACILAAQIVVDGRRTAWCQQHDMITLAPASARNYEMPALVSNESAGILIFLMSLPHPGADVIAAVHDGTAWFEKTGLYNLKFKPASDGSGRRLQASPGAGPLWARYVEIGSNHPVFGDRDKTIHDDLNEISKERRDGYSWFGESSKHALDQYATWAKAHPRA